MMADRTSECNSDSDLLINGYVKNYVDELYNGGSNYYEAILDDYEIRSDRLTILKVKKPCCNI